VSRTWHSEASGADAIGIRAVPHPGTVWHGGPLREGNFARFGAGELAAIRAAALPLECTPKVRQRKCGQFPKGTDEETSAELKRAAGGDVKNEVWSAPLG
jgi:hypothetical protein